MVRVWLLAIALIVVLTVFCAVDAVMLSRLRIRGLPRWAWVLIIIAVPVVGAVLWLTVGRGRRPTVVAPDDDPEFLAELGRLLDESDGNHGDGSDEQPRA
ncbi:MAG TPA: PLD nuclease N-terminal domain-containing protein [Microbacteriaceae bacterium]|nr:PLD nuclease N-terminal domain-containing protein [Microbacteriaceae bacterium]